MKTKTKKEKKVILNFRVPKNEARAIKLMANKLTKGNVTQMIRRSLLSWKPMKKDLQGIRKTTRA